MPIGSLSDFCFAVTVGPGAVCLTLPGGTEVCAQFPSIIPPSSDELIRQLFAQLNSALAPLNPIFNIIDAVLEVFEVIKAIATGDLQKIVGAVPGLAQKINKLLALLPQYCIPLLITQIIDALTIYLTGQIGQLERQRDYLNRIIAAELAATTPGNAALKLVVDCARHDLDSFFQNMNAGNAPINRLIGAINHFLHIIGLTECIPQIGALVPDNIDPSITALRKLVELLTLLRSLIPIPGPITVQSDTDC